MEEGERAGDGIEYKLTATATTTTITATTTTTTIVGEVKQQSIKVSDYRRGTPECLLPMPIK